MNIGIYIYDRAEVLDFSGPFEVFSTASRLCGDGEPFHAFLVSEAGATVSARGGYCVCPRGILCGSSLWVSESSSD